jgi:4-oxalocrotonate tautomerase family enzyme
MPIVQVEWLAGRSPEQKQSLVTAITDAMSSIGGSQREAVHVVLHDVPPANWGKGGTLFEQPQKDLPDGAGAPEKDRKAEEDDATSPAGSALSALLGAGEAMRVFDLEQPRKEGMPVFPAHRPGYSYLLHRHHEDEYRPEESGPRTSASGVIICMEHTGTHIDALCHQADGLTLYGGVPVKGAQTGKGFTELGVEEVPPIIAPGVLLDVATSRGVESLDSGYAVTAEDLEMCRSQQDVTIHPGDVVLVRTGNARRYWADPEGYLAGPGMAAGASRWLAERQVLAVGADNMAWDLIGVPDPDLKVMLPGHLILLARLGIYIIENLQLEELASARHHRFSFFCTPLKFVGATGSPVRPLAIVPDD